MTHTGLVTAKITDPISIGQKESIKNAKSLKTQPISIKVILAFKMKAKSYF